MRLRRPGVPTPALGVAAGVASIALATAVLVPVRTEGNRAVPALLFVAAAAAAALLGGRVAALTTAAAGTVAYDLAFVPPYWDAGVAFAEGATFLAVASVVGLVVARQSDLHRAARAAAEDAEAIHRRYEVLLAERERLAEETNRLAVLEQVDHQRAALLRSVSHDLRTPLATIRAVTSDLRAGVAYDEATVRDLLDLVGDEAERLDRIVANMLDLSRIEAGALQPDRQAVALEELVANRVRRLGRLFRQVRLQVDFPPDLPLVDADYTQLDQVLTNLLENAARHSPPKSTVRIGARRRDAMVEVWVADEGVGLPPFERERVFEPFRRGQGGRSGVGLAICRAIVEAHGGHIDVEGAPGGGARFSFTVPARRG